MAWGAILRPSLSPLSGRKLDMVRDTGAGFGVWRTGAGALEEDPGKRRGNRALAPVNREWLSRFVRIGGIDLSSWLSGASYLFTFYAAMLFEPERVSQLNNRADLAIALLASAGVFFIAVARIQRDMRLSLAASYFGAPSQLNTRGAFAWTRNPIYVAFLVPLSTLGLLSAWAALAGLIFYVTVMTLFVISREEAELKKEFGAEYSTYCARVPRWFGPL